jgi:hypothetical protein
MVVKTTRVDFIINMAGNLMPPAYFIFMLLSFGKSGGVLALIAVILCEPFIIRSTLARCKICVYDKSGCTVRFAMYHKTYSWDQITSRYLDDFENTYTGRRVQFNEGIFFSTQKYRRPKWMSVETYCELTHPISSFFVLFPPKYLFQEREKIFGIELDPGEPPFMVDREEFLSLLDSWGVEITDVSKKT